MVNYKAMTPEQSANHFSVLLGRPVRYSRNIYADREVEDRHLKAYSDRGVAARICDDGSIVLYGKPEHNGYFNLLKTAVYQLMVEKGPEGLLPSLDLMRMATERSVRYTDGMSDVDLKAFCMSCSDGNVSGMKTAADILHVAFKGAQYPEGLERSVCNGLKAYRYGILEKVREGSDEALIEKFAMETASPYSGHRHLHLGKPEGAMKALGYPDVNLIMDVETLRKQAAKMDLSVMGLMEQDVIHKIKNPIAVVKSRFKDSNMAILDLVKTDGEIVVYYFPDKKNIDKHNKLGGFSSVSPDSLCRIILYKEKGENFSSTLLYAENKQNSSIKKVLEDVLKNAFCINDKKGEDALHRDSAQDAKARLLNVTANILQNFKNPKNFDDLEKNIAESIKKVEAQDARRLQNRAKEISGTSIPALPSSALNADAKIDNISDNTKRDNGSSLKSEALKNLSRPIADGGFSKVTQKKFFDKGISNAGDIRSRLMLNNGEERFAEDFGQKALRDAKRWLDELGISSLRVASRQKVSEETSGLTGASLAEVDFFRALREFPKETLPGQVVMPVSTDGRLYRGMDSYQLSARQAANARWKGCNVFLSKEDMAAFGLTPLPSAEPVSLLSKDGLQVWNLMDLDMGDAMKERLVERYREMTPAVPAPMIRQMATFTPQTKADVASIAAHLDSRFDVMSGGVATDGVDSLETSIKNEVPSIEKRYDPSGTLREHLFPPVDIHRLFLMGEAHVDAEVSSRPVMGYDISGAGQKQHVDITLRLENDGIAVYSHKGERLQGKLRDLLKNGDRRIKKASQKVAVCGNTLEPPGINKKR